MPKVNYGFKGDSALTLTQAVAAGAAVSSQDYGYVVQLGGITPAPEPPTDDPYFQKVAFLSHLNSKTDGDVVDSGPINRRLMFEGGTLTTTAGDQSPIGGGAIQLSTAGLYNGGALASMFAFNTGVNAGTGDFTLEWWAKFSSAGVTNGEGVILTGPTEGWAGGASGKWRIGVKNQQDASTGYALKRRLALSYFNQSPVRLENVWSAYIDDFFDTWTHYAISRTGGVTKVYANGQQLTLGIDPAYNDPFNPFATTATSAQDSANWLFPWANASQYNSLAAVLFGFTDYKIAGFVDEVRYTVGVGRYANGCSVPTAAFPDSGPVIAPDAPTTLVATAGDAQIAMTWVAPARNGGASITDYIIQYSTDNGSTWTTFADGQSTTASATITGLTNGSSYRVRVAAVNSAGTGDYATSGTIVCSPPISITQQPLNTYTSTEAATATLSVTATGGGGSLTYQWQFYGPDYPNNDYNNQWRDLPSQTASSVTLSANYFSNTIGNYDFFYSPSVQIRCAIAAPGGTPTYTQVVRFMCLANIHYLSPSWYTSNGSYANYGTPQTLSPSSGESVRLDLNDYAMGGIDMSWFTGNDMILKIQVATTGPTSSADWTDLTSTGYRGYMQPIYGYDIPASTGTKYYRAIGVVNWPFAATNGTGSFTPSSPHVYFGGTSDVLQVTWPVTIPDPILYMPFDSTLHDVSNANAANNLQFAGNGPSGDSGASIDTALKQVGAGSLRLNGVNGMRSTSSPTAPALARDNFCLEWWQNFDSPGTAGRKLIDWLGDTYASQFRVESSGSGWRVVIERMYNDGDGGAFRTQTLSYSHATGWHHIAFVRQSGTWRLYVDGVQQVSAAIPVDADAFEPNTEVSFATGRIGIGANASTSFSSTVIPAGNVDELRLTRNAKYPNGTTFTPS